MPMTIEIFLNLYATEIVSHYIRHIVFVIDCVEQYIPLQFMPY